MTFIEHGIEWNPSLFYESHPGPSSNSERWFSLPTRNYVDRLQWSRLDLHPIPSSSFYSYPEHGMWRHSLESKPGVSRPYPTSKILTKFNLENNMHNFLLKLHLHPAANLIQQLLFQALERDGEVDDSHLWNFGSLTCQEESDTTVKLGSKANSLPRRSKWSLKISPFRNRKATILAASP